jgi:translocator protein
LTPENLGLLALSTFLCLLPGFFGAAFTARKVPGWYAGLRKPSFNPPSRVFGPVWTFLYLLMAAALYRILSLPSDLDGRTAALIFFFIQLGLNGLWSYLFFGLESPREAFKEISALWVFLALSLREFGHLDPLSGWLLAPVLAWVTFAAVLNFSIMRLNR